MSSSTSQEQTTRSGETQLRTRRRSDHWLLGLITFLVIVSTAGTVIALFALDHVADVERQDRDVARSTAYRLCSRNSVDRAFAHSAIRRARGDQAMVDLQDYRALAILDCRPNLDGLPALPMEGREHIDFVDRWERKELTREETGICPGTPIGTPLRPGLC